LGDVVKRASVAAQQASANMARCPQDGTVAPAGTKFCPECGSPMVQPVADACPNCGKETKGAKFCPECGTKIERAPAGVCPQCGAETKGAKFCPECGTKLV
jgi:predicted amidophosphoribosyltransferase